MKTKTTRTVVKEVVSYLCDDCQRAIKDGFEYRCLICEKDLCNVCVVEAPRTERTMELKMPHFCKSCWTAGEKVRELVTKESERHVVERTRLWNMWIDLALKKQKVKK